MCHALNCATQLHNITKGPTVNSDIFLEIVQKKGLKFDLTLIVLFKLKIHLFSSPRE